MKLKSCIPGAVGVLLLSAVLTSTASPLTERDLVAPGDGLITYDPATGARWLDVSATAGMSYNQVRASEFYTKYGLRHASRDEVAAFVGRAIPGLDYIGSFYTIEEMLADSGARAALDLYRLWSGRSDLTVGIEGARDRTEDIYGVVSDSAYHFVLPPFPHATLQWRFRLRYDEGMFEPYTLYFEEKDPWSLHYPGEDEPFRGGHFLVSGLPEQVHTLWLLLPVTGLLFLSRFRRLGQPT